MNQETIYNKNTIEFATVAKEYCAFIEQVQSAEKDDFVKKSLKILPLLYLKASMLPEVEYMLDEETETYVSEELYEYVRSLIGSVMGDSDTYLEVFTQDMQYSENPIQENVSEAMADIYQDLRDFIYVYSMGFDDTMNDALARCIENFRSYWGQKLVNVLRQLHNVAYTETDNDDDNFGSQMGGDNSNWLFDNQKNASTIDDESDEWNKWG